MNRTHLSQRPNWKKSAIHGAVALALVTSTGLVFADESDPPCDGSGSGTVTSDRLLQCTPSAIAVATVNSGVAISVTSDAAVLYVADLSGSFINQGTVTATATGNNAYAEAVVVRNTVTSTGSIANSGQASAASIGDSSTYATGVSIDTLGGEFRNLAGGLVTATTSGTSGTSRGVDINQLDGTFSNAGTVRASATATDNGYAWVAGVELSRNGGADSAVQINNAGLIQASATGSNGYAVGLSLNDNSYGGSSGMTITNSGTIRATADGGEGVGFWGTVYSYSGDRVATLHNSGTISGTSGAAYNGYSVQTQGFNIDNAATGQLIGAFSVDAGNYSEGVPASVSVTNAGLIDLPLWVAGNMGPMSRSSGSSGSSGFVNGDFTQTATGTLRFAADSAEAGGYSQLVVTGTANLTGTLAVNVLNSGDNLAIGNTLGGVIQAGTLNGTFSRVNDNSVLFNFKDHYYTAAEGDVYTTPRMDLEVVKGVTAEQAVNFTDNLPSVGAARTFDTIIDQGTSDPGMQEVINLLGALDTEKKVSDAVSQTLPLLTSGSMLAAGNALSGINRVIQARIEAKLGLSSGDVAKGDKNMWLKPFGSRADQDDDGAVSGFKVRTTGFAIGADGLLSDTTRAGVAFAYAKADADSNSSVAPQSANVNVYQLIGYGSYSLDDRTNVSYQFDLGNNKNEGSRTIGLTSAVAKSDYDSLTAHAGLGVGRVYQVTEQTSWLGSVRADYTWIKDKSYSETGAGALNLNVDGRTTEELILGADAKVIHKLTESTTLTANIGVGYDTMSKQASVTAAFAGAPGLSFVTKGLEQDPWMVRGGFGLVHKTEGGVELTARYDLEYRTGFTNQTASVKARWAF